MILKKTPITGSESIYFCCQSKIYSDHYCKGYIKSNLRLILMNIVFLKKSQIITDKTILQKN